MPLRLEGPLRLLEILGRDADVGLAAEAQIEDDGIADHALHRQLRDARMLADEVVRRVDVGAGVNRHLDHVGDEPLVLPANDGAQLEVRLLRRERGRVPFLHGHAQVDDAHGGLLAWASYGVSLLRLERIGSELGHFEHGGP